MNVMINGRQFQVAVAAALCACVLILTTGKGLARPMSREKALERRVLRLEALLKEQQALIRKLLESSDKAEVARLHARVKELEEMVRTLTPGTAQAPPPPPPATPPSPSAPPPPPATGSEKQLPDISVIANASSHFTSDRSNPDRNRILLNEAEIGMQGHLYPTIRGDAFFSFGREAGENEVRGELEEAYATFLETPLKGVSVKGGKMRIDFGKTNKIHRHHLPYEDLPAVQRNFLGGDGLNGHGVEVDYLLPTGRNFFAQLQVGYWRPVSPALDAMSGLERVDAGSRIADQLVTSRLWLSKEIGADSELELGLNTGWGRSAFNGAGDGKVDPIRLYAADLTFRHFPGPHQRLLLQAEWMRHHRELAFGSIARSGYYFLGAYQFNKHWEAGVRYDNASLPAPSLGHESAVTAFLTNNLTESTYLRYQLKHGTHTDGHPYNEFILQFVWGLGPHAHPLR